MQLVPLLLVMALASLLSSCGGGDSSTPAAAGAPSDDIVISGQLNLISSPSKSVHKARISPRSTFPSRALSTTATNYCLACVTFEASPKSCPTSNACDAVAADGSFELTCDSFKNKNYGCFLYTEDYAFYKPLVFAKDEENLSSVSGTSDVAVEITLDTDTGQVGSTIEYVEPEAVTTDESTVIDTATATAFQGTYSMACHEWSAIVDQLTPAQLDRLKELGARIMLARICLNNNNFSSNEDNARQACFANHDGSALWMAGNLMSGLAGQANDSADNIAFNALLTEWDATSVGSAARRLIAARIGYYVNCKMMGGGGSGPSMFFHPTNALSTDGSYTHMGVWDSEDNFIGCGSVEKDFSWQFFDGTTAKKLAVIDDNTVAGAADATTNQQVLNNLAASLQHAIDFWFPVLNVLGAPATTKTVATNVCRFVKNWPANFWNGGAQKTSADLGHIYENDGGASFSCSLWNGSTELTAQSCVYTGTQPTRVGVAVSKNADGWMEHTAIADQSTILTNQNVEACFSWYKFWSSNENPLVKKGALITECEQWGSNGVCTTERKEICDRNRFHPLNLVPNANGKLEVKIGSTVGKYDLVEFGAVDGNGHFQGIYDQICKVTYSAGDPEYLQFPAHETTANITTILNKKYGSSGDEGKKFAALYEILFRNDDMPSYNNLSSTTFNYWDRNTNLGGQVACSAIAAGSASATDIVKAFQNSWGGWDAARLLICVFQGLSQGHYDGGAVNVSGGFLIPTADQAKYATYGAKLQAIKENSCVPNVQVEQICTTASSAANTGTNATMESNYQCVTRAFCSDPFKELGGCENAAPTGRGPLLTFKKLGDDIYEMFEFDSRVRSMWQWNQSTNKSVPYLCNEVRQMSIRTTDVVMSGSSVASFDLALDSDESEVCKDPDGNIYDGEGGGGGGAPPFMKFVRVP